VFAYIQNEKCHAPFFLLRAIGLGDNIQHNGKRDSRSHDGGKTINATPDEKDKLLFDA
jgi:hypothetical protein